MLEKSGRLYGYSEIISDATFYKINLDSVEKAITEIEKDSNNKWIEEAYIDGACFVIPVQTEHDGIVEIRIES